VDELQCELFVEIKMILWLLYYTNYISKFDISLDLFNIYGYYFCLIRDEIVCLNAQQNADDHVARFKCPNCNKHSFLTCFTPLGNGCVHVTKRLV
jgi:hypothetical protein